MRSDQILQRVKHLQMASLTLVSRKLRLLIGPLVVGLASPAQVQISALVKPHGENRPIISALTNTSFVSLAKNWIARCGSGFRPTQCQIIVTPVLNKFRIRKGVPNTTTGTGKSSGTEVFGIRFNTVVVSSTPRSKLTPCSAVAKLRPPQTQIHM